MEEETVGVMFPCSSVDAVNGIGTNQFPSRIRFITESLAIFICYGSEILCTCRSDVTITVTIFGENVGAKSFYIIYRNRNRDRERSCINCFLETFVICIRDLSADLIAEI